MHDAGGLPPAGGAFAALRVREFRVLWTSAWASYIPFFMANIVQSVVAFDLSGKNRAVGTVVFAQGIAMALLAPLGGAGADRWPKRRVLALTQSVTAATFGSLGLLHATGRLTLAALAAGSLVIGIAVSFLGPARQAFAAELVPGPLRGNAVSLNQVPLTGSQVLGPGIAGLVLASPFGASGAYALMSALYVISALALLLLPPSVVRADAGETHVLADLGAGLRYVGSHRRLRLLVGFFVGVVMAGLCYGTVMPGLVENRLGRPAEAVSVLFLTSALGGLCAALLAARVADSPRARPIFIGMSFVFALGLLGLSAAPSFRLAIPAQLVVGIGFGGLQSLNAAVIVRATEPAYFGRVFSLSMLAFAGVSLMGLPVGFLADAIGERGALATLATGVAVIAAVVAIRLRRLERAEADTSAAA